MKGLFASLSLLAIATAMAAGSAFAATTQTQSAIATIASLLSIELAEAPDSTFGSGAIPWVEVDQSQPYVPPTGHVDTKPDVGLICRSNGGTWYLQMQLTSATLQYHIVRMIPSSGVINRNTSMPADGVYGANTWYFIPPDANTAYRSGPTDTINTPLGTFIGINYSIYSNTALTPLLEAGIAHTGTITYTITRTP